MKKKILIVDDDMVVVKLIESRLKVNGYDVAVAYDGEEAFKAVSKENPDLIILDIMLPGLNGYEVCKRLREDAAFSGIPIVMLTARAQKDDIHRGAKAGADAYITKPFDPQDMLAKIKNLLGTARKTN